MHCNNCLLVSLKKLKNCAILTSYYKLVCMHNVRHIIGAQNSHECAKIHKNVSFSHTYTYLTDSRAHKCLCYDFADRRAIYCSIKGTEIGGARYRIWRDWRRYSVLRVVRERSWFLSQLGTFFCTHVCCSWMKSATFTTSLMWPPCHYYTLELLVYIDSMQTMWKIADFPDIYLNFYGFLKRRYIRVN